MTRRAPNVAPARAIVGKIYTVEYGGRSKRLRYLGLVEQGTRWEKARFEQVRGERRRSILPTSMIDRMTRSQEGAGEEAPNGGTHGS